MSLATCESEIKRKKIQHVWATLTSPHQQASNLASDYNKNNNKKFQECGEEKPNPLLQHQARNCL